MDSKLQELSELLKHKKSKKYYAEKLNISEEEVEELLKELKDKKNNVNFVQTEGYAPMPKFTFTTTSSSGFIISNTETDHKTGDKKFVIESDKPLSPKEIEELAGVDNISTFVDKSWLKSHKNGTWTYSILVTCKIKDFYNTQELEERVKEIFRDKDRDKLVKFLKESKQKLGTKVSINESLFIYIADDHAGINIKDSLHNKEYGGSEYARRLLTVVEEVKKLNKTFESIYIIRLGDDLDGYNGKTTRYDHSLDSLSNKEQFDIFTTANKLFYDELFSAGLAEKFIIRNLLNSNHSGNGFSYIANKALEFWLAAKFKNVEVQYQEKFIDVIEYGNHIIGLTHGKDQKYMNTPMPVNLDYRTDLWLMDYFKQYQQEGRYIHTIKGDMHKHAVNIGKFGRYVNIPSIANSSNWVEHNFGDSKAGVVLEIFQKDKDFITTIPIWF